MHAALEGPEGLALSSSMFGVPRPALRCPRAAALRTQHPGMTLLQRVGCSKGAALARVSEARDCHLRRRRMAPNCGPRRGPTPALTLRSGLPRSADDWP